MKRFISLLASLSVLAVLTPGIYAQSVEMNSAKLYKKQGEIDKSIEWFEKAIAKKPDNPESHFLLGELYGQKNRMADMVREFDASLSYSKKYEKEIQMLRQKYFADNFNGGVKAANAQDYPAALQAFTNARNIDPKQIDTYKNLAFVYLRLDSIPAALAAYRELLAIKPDDHETYVTIASIHTQRKDYSKAAEALEKAVTVAPDSARPRIIGDLGIMYDEMGKRDEAMKTYQDALKMNPGNKDLLFNLGRLYLLRDDYPNAIKQLMEVLKTNPDDFYVNYSVGHSYLMIGERLDKKARNLEDEAMASKNKKKPDTVRIDSLRQAASEQFKAAIPYLKKAVELKPDEANAWQNLGVGYMRTGKTAEGTKAISKSDSLRGEK